MPVSISIVTLTPLNPPEASPGNDALAPELSHCFGPFREGDVGSWYRSHFSTRGSNIGIENVVPTEKENGALAEF